MAADVTSEPDERPITDDPARQLEWLRKRGRFDEFIQQALQSADDANAKVSTRLLKVEALLAVGLVADAELEAQHAANLAREQRDFELLGLALRRWATARSRQSKPLAGQWFDDALAQAATNDATIELLRFWSSTLHERPPFAATIDGDRAAEIPSARTISPQADQLNAIAARVNGVELPAVYIDTGEQHVLLTREAAATAGVIIGAPAIRLSGFKSVAVSPGVIDTLELGAVTIHNVPVLVGDSAPLVQAQGQMSLGTELMHHVRFTIDYPGRRVLAELSRAPRTADDANEAWEIPLWTFSQICLAQGQMPGGALARVLVDTGNGAGSYVSVRWAHRHLPDFPRARGPIIFKTKHRNLALDKMDLGSQSLADWPLADTLPLELERLDAVDVLVGHDLLGSFRLTIDMDRRQLRLVSVLPDRAAVDLQSPATSSSGRNEN
ncbi:MAG TPA: retropepsin-like aspartic protease [Pirellulales bacterium]|nr:retropepsin-like aspartic protease [Pirellulales bacterium]